MNKIGDIQVLCQVICAGIPQIIRLPIIPDHLEHILQVSEECITDRPTDGPTDRRTDRWTDKASYRVACPQLKIDELLDR